jgi:four helix bundle protein
LRGEADDATGKNMVASCDLGAARIAHEQRRRFDQESPRPIVWQRAMQVRRDVRLILLSLPRLDRVEIGGQVARAALSIPANIAEGHNRLERADYKQFLSFSRGSVGELDTHLIPIAEDHPRLETRVQSTLGRLNEVSRMVTSIIVKL